MAFITTARRINPTIRRRSGAARKNVYAPLFLTSMVDMFAILVIFLLNSFNPEGEIITLPRGLELPEVQNTGQLTRVPSIIIGLEELTFDNEVIATTEEVAAATEWNIPKLQQFLVDRKAMLEEELKLNPNLTPEELKEIQMINISADRRLPFATVKKVIYTAGFAGFPDFRFAVFKGDNRLIRPEN